MIQPTPLPRSPLSGADKLNIVILYDERHMFTNTTEEHVAAFRRYSRHNVFFVPATRNLNNSLDIAEDDIGRQVDLSIFDVAIVHYAVRLAIPNYLMEGFAEQLATFNGLKILFIQDEYEATETARRWMERLQFDIVYTCVPEEGRGYVYPPDRFPNTEFLPTLTGYVPDDRHLEDYITPLEQRQTFIGYRGRALPYFYGTLGYEKYQIGMEVKKRALKKRIPVNIEVDAAERIYGTDWYRFLGSVRGMLGSESGSNVFDFDGSIKAAVDTALRIDPTATFEEIHRTIVAPYDGRVRMNQISPKIFEAIRLRTALILFEGFYSGIVQAETHYIPLKKDFSNLDEIFKKLGDVAYLKELTDRAYRDIIGGGHYTYRHFIEGVDADIEARVKHGPRCEIFATPVGVRVPGGALHLIIPKTGLGYSLSSGILGGVMQREQLRDLINRHLSMPTLLPLEPPPAMPSFRTYLQQKLHKIPLRQSRVPALAKPDGSFIFQYMRLLLTWLYLYWIRQPVVWLGWCAAWLYWYVIRMPILSLLRLFIILNGLIRRLIIRILRRIYYQWAKPLMCSLYRQGHAENKSVLYYLLRPFYRLLPGNMQDELSRRVRT